MTSKKSSDIGGSRDGRYRNFATVVYPESAPSNWFDIIGEAKIPVLVSPLHDVDINPGGEPKKPHYHVIVAYEGKKSLEQVTQFFSSFGGVGLEIVQSLRGYSRYLCHLDNPEKAQYNTSDVRSFGGIDFNEIISLNSDRYRALGELIDFCELNDIQSFSELVVYSRIHRPDWFKLLADNSAIFVSQYLKSRSWTSQNRGVKDE